jgi:cystathionine beta-lyase
MSEFDFDALVDRSGTGAIKWDKYAGRDVIPMWVADMDFRSPPPVIQALHQRADHGVFGYTDPPPGLSDTIVAHLAQSYGWQIEPQWLMWLPGLVTGLNVVCKAVGGDGDQVLTATPIYHPFLTAPLNQRRELLRVPMRLDGARWAWDLERLEAAITSRSRLLLVCSPHNPVGRAFMREELLALARVAEDHDLLLCSDEIHCGLVLDMDKPHIPLASLGASIADRTITLMAASKTFNLPGLGCAFAVVSNPALRARLERAGAGIVPRINAMGFAGTLAAYRDGEPWRRALVDYLRGNRDLVVRRIREMPGLSITPVEATYLAWIDCRAANLAEPAKFFEQAGVGLYDGRVFDGAGYVRLNFGCPRALVSEALARMERALHAR